MFWTLRRATPGGSLQRVSYGWRMSDDRLIELCDECGFSGRETGDFGTELVAAFDALLVERAASAHPDLRPAPGVWSSNEYSAHCLDMASETIQVIQHATPHGGPCFADLAAARSAVAQMVSTLAPAELLQTIPLDGAFPITADWMLAHLLHDLQHHLLDMRRGRAKLELARHQGPTVDR